MSGDYLADSPEHEFTPQDRLLYRCGFTSDGMLCGYDREDHEALWPREPAAPDDLAAFIADRYDEAEALAKAASHGTKGKWAGRLDEALGGHLLDDSGEVVVYDEGAPSDCQFDHIAANDPAHRLADIKLKRAVLATHARVESMLVECGTCHESEEGWAATVPVQWPCATVRQLGTEFASHPDYREDWKP